MPHERRKQPLWRFANPVHMDVRKVSPSVSTEELFSRTEAEPLAPLVLCLVVSKSRDSFPTIPAAAEWAKTLRTWQKGVQQPAERSPSWLVIPKFEFRPTLPQGLHSP